MICLSCTFKIVDLHSLCSLHYRAEYDHWSIEDICAKALGYLLTCTGSTEMLTQPYFLALQPVRHLCKSHLCTITLTCAIVWSRLPKSDTCMQDCFLLFVMNRFFFLLYICLFTFSCCDNHRSFLLLLAKEKKAITSLEGKGEWSAYYDYSCLLPYPIVLKDEHWMYCHWRFDCVENYWSFF